MRMGLGPLENEDDWLAFLRRRVEIGGSVTGEPLRHLLDANARAIDALRYNIEDAPAPARPSPTDFEMKLTAAAFVDTPEGVKDFRWQFDPMTARRKGATR